MKKKYVRYLEVIGGVLVFIIAAAVISTGYFKVALDSCISYLEEAEAHAGWLAENTIRGVCSGAVTFGALFITIRHEDKKDRRRRTQEREDEERRILSNIRPFIDLEVKGIITPRESEARPDNRSVCLGKGVTYIYAEVIISNVGNGYCKNLEINGKDFLFSSLKKDEQQKIRIYLFGISKLAVENKYELPVSYSDTYGNVYKQIFKIQYRVQDRILRIYSLEPVIVGGMDEKAD